MCLSTVIHNNKKDSVDFCNRKLKQVYYKNQLWYVGWKSINVLIDNKIYLYHGNVTINKIGHSTDICAKDGIEAYDYNVYKAGFHIWKTRQAARKYNYYREVYKVLFKTPTCIGQQKGEIVIIAKTMIVLDKEQEKCLKTK